MTPSPLDCWHDGKSHVKHLESKDRYPLDQTPLGKILIRLVKKYHKEGMLIDVGCGDGQLSEYVDNYEGWDISDTIDNVSRKAYPNASFAHMTDAEKEGWEFLHGMNTVVMSAFIDVMREPLLVLNSILEHCTGTVILHRQEVSGDQSTAFRHKRNPSYGGWTWHSILHSRILKDTFKKHGFEIVEEVDLNIKGWHQAKSYVLCKIK